MRLAKLLLSTILALPVLMFVNAQNTVSTPPLPSEITKYEKVRQLLESGDLAVKSNNLEEAITAYRQAVKVEGMYDHFSNTAKYCLAKALAWAGHNKEALATYKRTLRWDAETGEIVTTGSPMINVCMDYAVLLAQCNKLDEAKAVYYVGLRRAFNPRIRRDFEPIPFLVVFDDDPQMDVWELTKENMITAALMAKMPWMQSELPKSLDEVLRRDSSLVFAQICRVMQPENKDKDALISYAEGQAKTERERQWIRDFRDGKNLAPVGAELRRNSQVLSQAKKDLEKIHSKIAD